MNAPRTNVAFERQIVLLIEAPAVESWAANKECWIPGNETRAQSPPAARRWLKALDRRNPVCGVRLDGDRHDAQRTSSLARYFCQNRQDVLNILHLVDFFRLELQVEFLFEREHQIQVMN